MDTELLKSCAHILNVDIVSKANGLQRFSCLADEAANISQRELSRGMRFVKKINGDTSVVVE